MGDARSRLAEGLEGWASPEQVRELVGEVLAIRKPAWADVACRGCGQKQRVQVEVPDAKAVARALVDLANQSWGRPGEARVGDAGVTFIRRVVRSADGPDLPGAA